jgi:hypothetical protein
MLSYGAFTSLQYPEPPAPTFDTDAQAFFTQIETVEGITLTTTEKDAVNDLVVGLKADSLWTKMDSIYPFVGSDADACKYNLKDPQDTNAAYRITWYGTNTFNSDGVTCGTTNNDFGQTYNEPGDYGPTNGTHLAVWCNNVNNVRGYDLGAFRGSGGDRDDWALIISYGNSTQYACFNALNYTTDSHTPAENFYMSNNLSNTTEVWRGTTLEASSAQTIDTSLSWGSNTIALGGSYRGAGTSVSDGQSGRGYALATVGQGFTSTEAGNFYTRANTFVTDLSR